jgi:hypothetical protein
VGSEKEDSKTYLNSLPIKIVVSRIDENESIYGRDLEKDSCFSFVIPLFTPACN